MPAPRQAVARRRLALLALAALVALVVGVTFGASGGDGDEEPAATATEAAPEREAGDAVARLGLRRQLGQLLVAAFDGTSVPDYMRRRLRDGDVSGAIVFGGNIASPSGLGAIADSLQRASLNSALVMVDQEGGTIRALPFAGPEAGQASQGGPADVRRAMGAAGRQLRAAGINVDLAPVADVATDPAAAMAGRAYPGDATQVAARTAAAVRGLAGARVAATAKHFPGFGAATVNTDDGSATIAASRADLDAEHLPPFEAAIAAGAPLIMLSHALYPALDANRIASQSRRIATGLLRDELGFEGVAITDSLEAQAVLDRSDVAVAAERALRAGADLILMTGSASWNLVQPHLLRVARRDPRLRARIAESAARVLALKRGLDLRGPRPSSTDR